MESDIQQHHRLLHDHQYELNHRQTNSAFTRHQSAPSSYFTSLVDRKLCEQFVSRPSSPETERIFARFMTSGSGTQHTSSHRRRESPVGEVGMVTAEAERKTQYLASTTVKSEAGDVIQKQSDMDQYTSGLHAFHQNQWRPPLPNKSINSGREANYTHSMEMGWLAPMRTGGNCSLLRQSSSPAELLPPINVESGFPFEYWEDSAMLSGDVKMSENQHMEARNQGPVLACHLSLPYSKSSGLVQLSDSVPCKIRAKRGCATHPRSIAERVRRTRITQRIRELQQLVPNMDKQANTSEMLDFAIEYIEGLQKQVQTLSNSHENCRCSNKQLQRY